MAVYELTGALAGKTIRLAQRWQFVNGEIDLTPLGPQDEKLVRDFLVKNWQVRRRDQHAMGLQTQGTKSSGFEGVGGVAEAPELHERGDANDIGGDAGTHSGRRGYPNAWLAGVSTGRDSDRIREAMIELDTSDDEHWTSQGLPRVESICVYSGIHTLTRDDIRMATKNLNRDELIAFKKANGNGQSAMAG